MNRRHSPIVILCALLLGANACDSSRAAQDPAPGYRGSIDGFDLSAYQGRVMVLNFWATWCGPCHDEIPHLVRLREDFPEEDLAIIGISVDRGRSSQIDAMLELFIEHFGINYPIYLDGEQKFSAAYDPAAGYMRFVPTTVIIDQQGQIYDTHLGLSRNAAGKVDPYGVLGAQVQKLLDGA